MEMFSRVFAAQLQGAELKVGIGVDYSCAIGGILCGVSVTRSHITRLSHLEEKSDADVIGCIDEEDEPKEAVCKVCNKSLEVDAYSHKQWKRCRAQIMGRGGLGGACKDCSPKVAIAAAAENAIKQEVLKHVPEDWTPDHLLCVGCKEYVEERHFPKYNNETRHPIRHADNADKVIE